MLHEFLHENRAATLMIRHRAYVQWPTTRQTFLSWVHGRVYRLASSRSPLSASPKTLHAAMHRSMPAGILQEHFQTTSTIFQTNTPADTCCGFRNRKKKSIEVRMNTNLVGLGRKMHQSRNVSLLSLCLSVSPSGDRV